MGQFETLLEAAKSGGLEQVRTIVRDRPPFINQRDEQGATALHYAAFGGHSAVVELLVEYGANINALDNKFGATPAGWAIEYIRELGGFLGIELSDFAFAIQRGDLEWSARFLQRFPRLRDAVDPKGKPFKQLALESPNPAIQNLFRSS